MASLGSRIKALREKSNINQKDFAKKIGVSNVVLSRYESDERRPDYDTLQLIADFFGVSLDYMLGRNSELVIQRLKMNAEIHLPITLALIWPNDIRKYRIHFNLDEEEVSKQTGIPLNVYKNYELDGMPSIEDEKALRNFYNKLHKKFENDKNDSNDIAKRLKQFQNELENSDGLAFDGEPMSDEAKESLLESMELLFRQTQRINKKFSPKKYREDE